MKKLFEKPMFHYTFVLTCVALVMGLFIGVINSITEPIIQANIARAKVEAYQMVLPGIDSFDEMDIKGDPASIQSKVIGKDANGNVLGYIFESFKTNKFGQMRMVISVDAQGKILGAAFVDLVQTYLADGTRTNLSLYVGSNINRIEPSGTLVAGATGSLDTVKEMFADIALSFSKMDITPADPLVAWYGEGYKLIQDSTFVPTNIILSKSIVFDSNDTSIGFYYHLRGSGKYYDDNEGAINLHVALSNQGVILGILMPKDDYGHTKSDFFFGKGLDLIESLKGTNIADFATDLDLKSGATNSTNLIQSLLEALGGNWS